MAVSLKTIRLAMVRWTGKFAVLALALSLWASPLMACMLPDALLTVEERECCKQMADDCGQMDMPASHSCCKLVVREADSYLVNFRFPTVHSVVDIVLFVTTTENSFPLSPARVNTGLVGHSPPVSPPETISILRI